MSVPTTRSRSLLRLFAGADRAVGQHSDLDELTGLPGRTVFERRLQRLLTARRHGRGGGVCTVMLIDCDGFRDVNRTLGYLGGDRALADIAERLRAALPGAHTIARVGGDEFAVLLDTVPDAPALLEQVERVLADVHEPLDTSGPPASVEASAGIVLCSGPEAAADAAAVLGDAAVALRLAKQTGRARVGVFEPSMHVALAHPDRRQPGLDAALRRREFALWFQPIVRLPDRSVAGVEALLRWRRPDGRLLDAVEFLPELESTGLIVDVGRWVVAEACARLAALRNEIGGELFVMVNVDAAQLHDESLIGIVLDSLDTYALDPHALVLQLTEPSAAIDDTTASAVLARLRDHGVRIALDDVGAGYSTMLRAQQLPVDIVTVNPSAVDTLAPIGVNDLVMLARSLGIDTLAEGIETAEQHDAIVRLGCRMAQGYCYAPPLSAQHLMGAMTSLIRG